jgi:hypothetical protein
MNATKNAAILVGSLRKEGWNRKMANALISQGALRAFRPSNIHVRVFFILSQIKAGVMYFMHILPFFS